jgi:hypothetical protein
MLPFQVPPFQLESAATDGAQTLGIHGIAKMSSSPRSVTFSAVRWAVPRDPSSVPSPVDGVHVCAVLGVG